MLICLRHITTVKNNNCKNANIGNVDNGWFVGMFENSNIRIKGKILF
jgi:hypothetical protein